MYSDGEMHKVILWAGDLENQVNSNFCGHFIVNWARRERISEFSAGIICIMQICNADTFYFVDTKTIDTNKF